MLQKKFKWRDAETKEWHVSDVAPAGAEPETVCLCSGTKDTKGEYIFEGDLLVNESEAQQKLWTVELTDGAFYAIAKKYANSDAVIVLPKKTLVSAANVAALQLRIVGNIFDDV